MDISHNIMMPTRVRSTYITHFLACQAIAWFVCRWVDSLHALFAFCSKRNQSRVILWVFHENQTYFKHSKSLNQCASWPWNVECIRFGLTYITNHIWINVYPFSILHIYYFRKSHCDSNSSWAVCLCSNFYAKDIGCHLDWIRVWMVRSCTEE